jgi:hypothetical protein
LSRPAAPAFTEVNLTAFDLLPGYGVGAPGGWAAPNTDVAPYISLQPIDTTVLKNTAAVFMGGATGTDPIWFEWYNRLSGVTGAIAGETGSSYTIASAQETDEGIYSFVARNSTGYAVSDDATLTVTTTAVITQQPASTLAQPGQSAIFSVAATTDPSYSTTYQWYKNGVLISGATSTSYTVAHINDTSFAGYSVIVTNGPNILTSNTAQLSLRSSPSNSPFSDIGMAGTGQVYPGASSSGRGVHNMGNSHGNQVDNSAGANPVQDNDQGSRIVNLQGTSHTFVYKPESDRPRF